MCLLWTRNIFHSPSGVAAVRKDVLLLLLQRIPAPQVMILQEISLEVLKSKNAVKKPDSFARVEAKARFCVPWSRVITLLSARQGFPTPGESWHLLDHRKPPTRV